MAQNVNKGNIYQAAERAGLNPAQKDQINSFADMYSKHTSLTNLPDAIAAIEYNQLSADQQKSMAEFFGNDETKPGQGAVMKAASWLAKPIVEPVKEVLKAANWASDQVTRLYRTGRIAVGEQTDLVSAFRRSGANGEQVYDESRIAKAVATYGQNRVYVAQQISAGIPLDKIIANAQNPEQKRIAAEASKPEGDDLLNEAVAKVNAAKYSFGRDIANAFLPKDMEGKSGLYTWLSGTGDAAFRIFLDPTIVLGKVAKGYNAARFALSKTVGTADKVENAFKYDSVNRFWTEYTKGLDDLVKARTSEDAVKLGEATTRLRRLNPAFGANGVDDALIKFAKDDMDGVLDVNTAKNFLSNAERIEPLFYGQAGLQIKVMPRLSAFRKKRVDLYTKGTRVFSLNDDSTDFLRNIVFDEADARGISTQEAALQSLIGRGDETVAEAAARTVARIKAEEAKRIDKFSVYAINKRIDNFSRKFNLIPDMDELGNHASPRAHIAFERYARLVYGKYSSRILGDIYQQSNLGQRRQMFNGLQSVVGELRGLRGTQAGRKLLETVGTVGRDAVYTNRAFDEANPEGFFPSVVNGADSALYPYQINERQAFITPQQLDRFAARDGFISNAWGLQYTKAADDAISTFVTGTLAGPRFPVRNAIEDYLFYLSNGTKIGFLPGSGIKSAIQIGKSRKLATDIRTAQKDLQLGLINRYAKAKDKELFTRKFDDIDKGISRSVGKDGQEVIIQDFYTTAAEKELAKRKALAEILLRDKFNDAQIGKFGNDFDRYSYEFSMYGDYENLLRSASEGAYNLNAGSDIVSRAKRISRKHGKVVDFTIDGEDYARQFGSFGEFSPLDQEGKLAWAFQIMTKAQDEFASEGMKLLKVHGSNRGAFVKAMAEHIDQPQFASLKPKFDRYVDTNYTSTQQASAIYDDLRTLFGRSDDSINTNLLDKVVKVDANGKLKVDAENFSIAFLPTKYTDIPKAIVGPKLLPAQQSKNIISDLNTRLWDFLGDANARLSRDQIVIDAAFNIRKELQPYLDDLAEKVGIQVATKQVIELSEKLAVERVLAFVDNPTVRTQMAWSMRNFARFYRATEDAYRRLYRTAKYNPEAIRKIALTYEGITHTGFVQRDDQGEPYFIYPGVAPVYEAMNKVLGVFGLGDKFVAPMPLQFGSDIRMLTPSANPESWLPTFSGPLAGLSLKTIYSIAGLFEESNIDALSTIGQEIKSTERLTLGEIGENQSFFQSVLPGHVNRLITSLGRDERDSQYASAFRKAVTYLEAGGHTPSSDATPGELAQYQKRLRSTITGILGTRFVLGFISPASPTTTLKSDMAEWVRDNGRVNFKQVYTKLIEEYTSKNSPDPIGEAMADWVKLFPDEVPYVINESEPEFQARFKTSNAAANWVDENKDLVAKYPEGAGFLIPQSGTFSWDAYQFLKDNGFRKTKLVDDFLKETFVSKDKYFYYTQRDKYEAALENAGSDSERKRINNAWKIWSGDFKSARPLLQEEFANSASNNIKRQASYNDLKRLLNESGVNNQATNSLRKMVNIYEEYLFTKDNVYNSRSERDIKSREFLRESTLEQLKDIARRNPNAKGAFEVLFSNFLRED